MEIPYPNPKNNNQIIINLCKERNIEITQITEHQYIVPLKNVEIVRELFKEVNNG